MSRDPGRWLALSMREPWLWSVIHAGKRIENRGASTALRGPFLLHRSSTMDPGYWLDAVTWMHARGLVRRPATPKTRVTMALPLAPTFAEGYAWPGSSIVAVASLVHVIPPTRLSASPEAVVPTASGEIVVDGRWHMEGHHGYMLEAVRDLVAPPGASTFVRGMPGLFYVPAEIVAAVGLPSSPAEYLASLEPRL